MALHRLVGIHRVQTGRIETRQPHVAHDHDLEGVLRVLELVRQIPPLLLVADVQLGGWSHDELTLFVGEPIKVEDLSFNGLL